MAEHTLPTRIRHGKWRNTLCQPKIDPGCGRTHSADRKSTWDVAEHTQLTINQPGRGGTHSADRKLIWEVAEQTLPTRYRLGRGGTHYADRKLTQDMAEHTLLTGN